MNIQYVRSGDYYIPDLTLPEESRPIGRWGWMHRDYLREHNPIQYNRSCNYNQNSVPYNDSYSTVTWETSSLRTWLNDSFPNAASPQKNWSVFSLWRSTTAFLRAIGNGTPPEEIIRKTRCFC